MLNDLPEEIQRQYEITFILLPSLKEEEINSFGEKTKKDIENLGGTLKKQEKPEKRKLAYPIKKFEFSYYLTTNFLLNPEKLKELFSIFKHKEQILRYMITSVEKKPSFAKAAEGKKKKVKPEVKKLKELTKEITEEEIETLKKPIEKKGVKKKEKEAKLEDIDKKLEEILGV